MEIGELIYYPFWQRAFLAALWLGLVYGLWGSVVVARRMAFFADAISHGALTGIAVGILLGVAPIWLALVVGVVIAALTVYIKNRTKLNFDTVLGLFLPFSMAMGVILLSLKKEYVPDLISFLFGNILTVSWSDLWLQMVLGLLSIVWLFVNYRKLILQSFDRGLAVSLGVNVEKEEFVLSILLSLVVVAGIKAVGIILVGALLVIPAVAARNIAKNFRQMMVFSGVIGMLSGVLGLVVAAGLDLPSGAVIVVVSMLLFLVSFFVVKN